MVENDERNDAAEDRTDRGPVERNWVWWIVPVAATLVAMQGVFTTSRIFYYRDLSAYFWSEHLWFRQWALSGANVLWDPYVGFGRSAISDPVRQILFPPVAALRLLLPATVGFNMVVVLAFVTSGLCTMLLLRRHVSPRGAALGAALFVVSGPSLSVASMPNLSWSVALAPLSLWATSLLVDAPSRRRFALVACAFALQYLAGEPVSLAATAAITVFYAAVFAPEGSRRTLSVLRVVAAGLGGLLLVMPAVLMLFDANSRAPRASALGARAIGDALHPFDLLGTVAPGLLGDFIRLQYGDMPIGAALHKLKVPYLISLFLGTGALALAWLGAAIPRDRRWTIFWTAILGISLVLALGDNTPIYVPLHDTVPLFNSFRSPSKFFIFGALAVSALAAVGVDRLTLIEPGKRPRLLLAAIWGAVGLGVLAAVAVVVAAVAPALVLEAAKGFTAGLDPEGFGRTGELLTAAVVPSGVRLLGVALAVAGLLWLATSERDVRRFAIPTVFVLVLLDPVMTNMDLGPTLDASLFARPDWVESTHVDPSSRVYAAPVSVLTEFDLEDQDVVPARVFEREDIPQPISVAVLANGELTFPSGWEVRTPINTDATMLAPREYWNLLAQFVHADPDSRARYLRRTGTRYYLLWQPPAVPAHGIYTMGEGGAVLYEADVPVSRVSVVSRYQVMPDLAQQNATMFKAGLDASTFALLDREPPPQAGTPGAPLDPAASILDDQPASVTVSASAPAAGGLVVLSDMYDPHWRAEVDGQPAEILRANGLFRAVAIAPGQHQVRFRYVPTPFYAGCAVSAAAALALALLALWPTARYRRRSA